MTLEEAIKHCEDVADYDCFTDDQRKCSEEHRQLADWLKELKERREKAQLSGEDATFDCISRQDAIEAMEQWLYDSKDNRTVREVVYELPSAEPEIIHCKDCRKHNVKVGFDEDGHTVWKEDACPLVSWRGKAKGHEFDYQHCSCAELRGEKDEQSDLQTGCD